jgi:hypothetical protein
MPSVSTAGWRFQSINFWKEFFSLSMEAATSAVFVILYSNLVQLKVYLLLKILDFLGVTANFLYSKLLILLMGKPLMGKKLVKFILLSLSISPIGLFQ